MNKAKNIKLTVIVLFCLATIAFIFNIKDNTTGYLYDPPPPLLLPFNNNISDSFLMGSTQDGEDVNFKYISGTLGFNLWHRYCGDTLIGGKHYPTGYVRNGAPADNLFADSSEYISQVQKLLDNIGSHHMKVLMHRPKIEYLCYGQRSDYQCEPAPLDTGMWFYSFNDHNTGIPETDSGAVVIHCRAGGTPHDAAGFVVKRLKANTEQCHSGTGGDAYRWDSECDWLIKPRIRVDASFVNNPSNFDKPVCKIIILNQDGNSLKEAVLKAHNFLVDPDNRYNGEYLEQYKLLPGDDSLIVRGAWGDKWLFSARGTREINQENQDFNHADIQVRWYGTCDMRIDYVRVDNDIAHNLFGTGQIHDLYMDWLRWEAEIAGHGTSPLEFYIELFEFNQIPCIAYVNRKLDALTGNHINVMADQYTFYQYHMARSEKGKIISPRKIKDLYIDRVNAHEVFTGNPYPLTSPFPYGCYGSAEPQFSEIPSTLPAANGGKILANDTIPEVYDTWLQNLFDGPCNWYEGGAYNEKCCPLELRGVFMFTMKNGDAVSKLCNIPFIAMLQAHQWVSPYEVDREPTNEELDLMTNLAISYGARGIIYWGFGSFSNNECSYSNGITESGQPRYQNIYGQPKWQKLIDINRKLKAWGPALMSFNNTDRHSYIFRDENERYPLVTNSYFRWIVTGMPGSHQDVCPEWHQGVPVPPPDSGLVYECDQNTYLQAATFKNSEADAYYFMIVNRRCSPNFAPGVDSRFPNGENGGRRKVKILFDTDNPQMSASVRWKISEVGNPSASYIFDKTANTYVDLGWFMPAEGKLYKLEPAE